MGDQEIPLSLSWILRLAAASYSVQQASIRADFLVASFSWRAISSSIAYNLGVILLGDGEKLLENNCRIGAVTVAYFA